MTSMELQAEGILGTAGIVAHWIGTTEEGRASWTPAVGGEGAAGRSVLDQVGECVRTNRRLAARIEGTPLPAPDPDAPQWEPVSLREAKEAFLASAAEVAEVVRGKNDSYLAEEIDMGGSSWPAAMLVGMVANHMMYHGGQICYIQTLYGDKTFRVPGMDD